MVLPYRVGCADAPALLSAYAASPVNVLTYHNDNGRTGLMPQETILTPANVNSATFGKVNFLTTDGKVDGEPLYASNVVINGVVHNVVYVVTEHDSIYAFDADTGAQLWKTTALLQGETPTVSQVFDCRISHRNRHYQHAGDRPQQGAERCDLFRCHVDRRKQRRITSGCTHLTSLPVPNCSAGRSRSKPSIPETVTIATTVS